jgi:hypothetical protein
MRADAPLLTLSAWGGASVKLLIVDDSSVVDGRLLEMLGGVEYLTEFSSIARSLHEAGPGNGQ